MMELLHIDHVEDAIAPLAYRLLKEKQIAGASLVVVRAGAPKSELEAVALQASQTGQMGGSAGHVAAAELRGRLEPLVYCRDGVSFAPHLESDTGVPALLTIKGFGYSCVEEDRVIDVHQTPFDCGSCARILTALAAMQLWQEEAIELDQDVNHYLPPGLQVDSVFSTPVNLARLLTHTSGFSDEESGPPPAVDCAGEATSAEGGTGAGEGGRGRRSRDETDEGKMYGPSVLAKSSLTRHLKANQQVRVSPPGTMYRDCEHNYLLVGSLVEHCSNLPFQRYMARRILGPLNMTTLGTVPPSNCGETHDFLRHVRPTAYTVTNMHGQLVRLPLPPLPYPIPLSPVTGLVATPKEMSNMLLACLQCLQETELGGGSGILAHDAMQEMHATHFRSQGSELAFGFLRRELWADGPTLLFHSADEVPGADCLFCLFPEHRIGVWIGCNTTPEDPRENEPQDESGRHENRFCEEILEAFIQRFFPLHGGKATAEKSPWFQTLLPARLDPLLDLFVFPCVGGSAVVMYEAWSSMLPDFIQVRAVQLPGRGSRVKEAPIGNMMELVEHIGNSMLPLLGDEPFAFFGHGMGAILAYEVARFVQRRLGIAPLHLFVSGQVHPGYYTQRGEGSHCWAETMHSGPAGRPKSHRESSSDMFKGSKPKLHSLPDTELALLLSSATRLSRQFRSNSLMLRAMMLTIRADIQAEETYNLLPSQSVGEKVLVCSSSAWIKAKRLQDQYPDMMLDGTVVACPVTMYIGVQDDHTCEPGLQGWSMFSTGPCNVVRLAGNHFYLDDMKSREQLLRSVGHTLVHQLSEHSNWITMGNTPMNKNHR